MAKFYCTKFTSGMNKAEDGSYKTTVVYIPKDWGLDPDKPYFITARRVDEPESRAIQFIRRMTMSKTLGRITLDRAHGFMPGEMVILTMEELDDDDPRIRVEKGDQELS